MRRYLKITFEGGTHYIELDKEKGLAKRIATNMLQTRTKVEVYGVRSTETVRHDIEQQLEYALGLGQTEYELVTTNEPAQAEPTGFHFSQLPDMAIKAFRTGFAEMFLQDKVNVSWICTIEVVTETSTHGSVGTYVYLRAFSEQPLLYTRKSQEDRLYIYGLERGSDEGGGWRHSMPCVYGPCSTEIAMKVFGAFVIGERAYVFEKDSDKSELAKLAKDVGSHSLYRIPPKKDSTFGDVVASVLQGQVNSWLQPDGPKTKYMVNGKEVQLKKRQLQTPSTRRRGFLDPIQAWLSEEIELEFVGRYRYIHAPSLEHANDLVKEQEGVKHVYSSAKDHANLHFKAEPAMATVSNSNGIIGFAFYEVSESTKLAIRRWTVPCMTDRCKIRLVRNPQLGYAGL